MLELPSLFNSVGRSLSQAQLKEGLRIDSPLYGKHGDSNWCFSFISTMLLPSLGAGETDQTNTELVITWGQYLLHLQHLRSDFTSEVIWRSKYPCCNFFRWSIEPAPPCASICRPKQAPEAPPDTDLQLLGVIPVKDNQTVGGRRHIHIVPRTMFPTLDLDHLTGSFVELQSDNHQSYTFLIQFFTWGSVIESGKN